MITPPRPDAQVNHIMYGLGVVEAVTGSVEDHRDRREIVIVFKDYGRRVLSWVRHKESIAEMK